MSIAEAVHIARDAHAGQYSKYTNEPYINHPMRVMNAVLLSENIVASEHYGMVAVLHDVIEDCDVSANDMRAIFGERVTADVLMLSNKYGSSDYPDMNRAERKRREFERLGQLPASLQIIKALDRIDNLSDKPEEMGVGYDKWLRFMPTYLSESQQLLEALIKLDDVTRNELEAAILNIQDLLKGIENDITHS